MKKFVTEDSFWQLFPGASLGVIVARGMKPANEVSPEDAQAIEQLLIRANALAEKHLESPTLSENAPVRAWRQAYQQFKTKRGARCSIENLLKRVLKGNPSAASRPRWTSTTRSPSNTPCRWAERTSIPLRGTCAFASPRAATHSRRLARVPRTTPRCPESSPM